MKQVTLMAISNQINRFHAAYEDGLAKDPLKVREAESHIFRLLIMGMLNSVDPSNKDELHNVTEVLYRTAGLLRTAQRSTFAQAWAQLVSEAEDQQELTLVPKEAPQ